MLQATNALVWFLSGLLMALGWVLGTSSMEWLLNFLRRRRNRLYDLLSWITAFALNRHIWLWQIRSADVALCCALTQ